MVPEQVLLRVEMSKMLVTLRVAGSHQKVFHSLGRHVHDGHAGCRPSSFSFYVMQIAKGNAIYIYNVLLCFGKVLCGLTQSFQMLGCGRRAGRIPESLRHPWVPCVRAD